MVEHIPTERHECPLCNREYESYDEAYSCMEECHMDNLTVEVITDDDWEYECEFCKKKHTELEVAEGCESTHAEGQDKYYNKEMLKRASEHPEQQGLFVFPKEGGNK